jgi:predicted RND superfamily exporter protein
MIVDLPIRFPRATLLVAAVLTIGLGVFAARFSVDSAVDRLLPEGDADGVYYEGVRRAFGSEDVVVVGIFADDVFAPATLARIDRLSTALAALSGVEEVDSLSTVQRVEMDEHGLQRAPLMATLPRDADGVAALRERVFADRFAPGLLVARDGRAAGIWVRFKPMSDDEFIATDLEGRLRATLASIPGPEELAVTGLPTIKVQAARDMLRDLSLFVPLALVMVTSMVIWAFRTWRGVLLPLVTMVMGLVWTIGIMVAAGDAFTLGTLVLPPLLMASGVAYAIHIVIRYYIELRRHGGPESLTVALHHVRLPVAMAALSTMIGFGTFVTSPIPSIRDFGLYAGLGIVVIFLACVAVIPAALTLLPPPRSVPARLDEGGWFSRFVAGCGELSLRHRWFFLVVFAVLLVIGGWGITHIQVETDYLRFFRERPPGIARQPPHRQRPGRHPGGDDGGRRPGHTRQRARGDARSAALRRAAGGCRPDPLARRSPREHAPRRRTGARRPAVHRPGGSGSAPPAPRARGRPARGDAGSATRQHHRLHASVRLAGHGGAREATRGARRVPLPRRRARACHRYGGAAQSVRRRPVAQPDMG